MHVLGLSRPRQLAHINVRGHERRDELYHVAKRRVYVTELVGTYLHRPQRGDVDDVLASASSKRMFGPLLWWELVLGVPPMH